MKTLQAEEGKVYVSADNMNYGKTIYLPDSVNESDWRQLTEAKGIALVEKTRKEDYEKQLAAEQAQSEAQPANENDPSDQPAGEDENAQSEAEESDQNQE